MMLDCQHAQRIYLLSIILIDTLITLDNIAKVLSRLMKQKRRQSALYITWRLRKQSLMQYDHKHDQRLQCPRHNAIRNIQIKAIIEAGLLNIRNNFNNPYIPDSPFNTQLYDMDHMGYLHNFLQKSREQNFIFVRRGRKKPNQANRISRNLIMCHPIWSQQCTPSCTHHCLILIIKACY